MLVGLGAPPTLLPEVWQSSRRGIRGWRPEDGGDAYIILRIDVGSTAFAQNFSINLNFWSDLHVLSSASSVFVITCTLSHTRTRTEFMQIDVAFSTHSHMRRGTGAWGVGHGCAGASEIFGCCLCYFTELPQTMKIYNALLASGINPPNPSLPSLHHVRCQASAPGQQFCMMLWPYIRVQRRFASNDQQLKRPTTGR